MSDYTMIMPFVDQSPNFVHGFECGRIWEMMNEQKTFESYLFHSENTEQVKMMCMKFYYDFKIVWLNETWSELSGVFLMELKQMAIN